MREVREWRGKYVGRIPRWRNEPGTVRTITDGVVCIAKFDNIGKDFTSFELTDWEKIDDRVPDRKPDGAIEPNQERDDPYDYL